MHFKDKLDFLIKITQTSNKELAKEISVDPSLISLLRSGRRRQPHDPDRIRQIALFFAKRCTADFQRNALAEMMGQTILRSSMPAEVLADYLTHWLQGDTDIVEQIIEGINTVPAKINAAPISESIPAPGSGTTFYFGTEGRRESLRRALTIMKEINSPGSILIAVDDHLDWLLSDYQLSNEVQAGFLKVIERGFTIHQIMPAMNFLNRYTEALRFWLPMYSTGKVKVYYYPRLRDNLYRHSNIIVPGHYVQAATTIGLGNTSHITLLSTEPELTKEYAHQFQEHLSLCRQALLVHSDSRDFIPCFLDIFTRNGDTIQMVSPLSINTMPVELLARCIQETENPEGKVLFQMYMDGIPHFEERLSQSTYIDMSYVSTVEEILAGSVYVASNYKTCPDHPCYTPETYILHLKNILRLMDKYDNYYFAPYPKKMRQDYNLIVSAEGPALLIRSQPPILMLEIRRPEMVMACYEHLMRIAEKTGYDGIQKTKVRMYLNDLINELQNHVSKE